MQRALVTGVTGFIGSHLARRLRAQGTTVHGIVRPNAQLDRIPDLKDELILHTDDGTTRALRGAVDAAQPDCTFHLATNFIGVHGADDVGPLVIDNIAFPARLVDALASGGHARFVNVGTVWQNAESEPYRPKNLYAATKQAFEDVVRFYTDRGDIDLVTVKLYDSYGPLDHRAKLLSALLVALRTGDELEMTSGNQLIDLVHVRDIVDALLLAPTVLPGTYALSSGKPLTLRDLVSVLERVAGRPVRTRWGARPDRDGDMRTHWVADPPLPGWVPKVSLDEGLGELLSL